MKIEIFGTGCAKCKASYALIDRLITETGAPVELVKVEDIAAIMGAGIMSTPGIRVDGEMKMVGKTPTTAQVRDWLDAAAKGAGHGA